MLSRTSAAAPPVARAAACASLGAADRFAVFSDGPFTAAAGGGTSITGRIAAKGDVTVDGVYINPGPNDATPTVVTGGSFIGGRTTGQGGTLNGGVRYADTLDIAQNFQVNGARIHDEPPFSFDDEFTNLALLSDTWGEREQTPGATVTLQPWGALELRGPVDGLNVFTIDGADFTRRTDPGHHGHAAVGDRVRTHQRHDEHGADDRPAVPERQPRRDRRPPDLEPAARVRPARHARRGVEGAHPRPARGRHRGRASAARRPADRRLRPARRHRRDRDSARRLPARRATGHLAHARGVVRRPVRQPRDADAQHRQPGSRRALGRPRRARLRQLHEPRPARRVLQRPRRRSGQPDPRNRRQHNRHRRWHRGALRRGDHRHQAHQRAGAVGPVDHRARRSGRASGEVGPARRGRVRHVRRARRVRARHRGVRRGRRRDRLHRARGRHARRRRDDQPEPGGDPHRPERERGRDQPLRGDRAADRPRAADAPARRPRPAVRVPTSAACCRASPPPTSS